MVGGGGILVGGGGILVHGGGLLIAVVRNRVVVGRSRGWLTVGSWITVDRLGVGITGLISSLGVTRLRVRSRIAYRGTLLASKSRQKSKIEEERLLRPINNK